MKEQNSQLKIGIVLNYVNLVLGGLVPLLYTPIMLKILDTEEYGLYKLSASITSYLALITFGLGAAITRYLIKARTEQGEEEERAVLALFIVIFRIVAVLALIGGGTLSLCLPLWYSESISAEELIRMQWLVILMSFNTAINFIASPYVSIVNAHERFLFLQSMAIISTILAPCLNLVALLWGYASIGLAVSSILSTVLFRLLFWIYVRRTMRIKPLYKRMPKEYIVDVISFSFWIFVSNIGSQLYEATDSALIGAVPALATTGLAIYSVGMILCSMINTINAGISSMLVPKANKMVFNGASTDELTNTGIRVGRIQALIIALFIFGFITFGREFVYFYVGEDYAISYWIAVVCMIPISIPLVQSFFLNIIIARNENRFRALTYLLVALINVVATWYMMKWIGVFGAALATSIANFIGPGLIMNWFYKKHIRLQIGRFWRSLLNVYFVPSILAALFLFLGKYINYYHIPYFIGGIFVFFMLYVSLQWLFIMTDYEKKLMKGLINR